MKSLDSIILKQFRIFKDRKEEKPDEEFEWTTATPKLVKKQKAKWFVWRLDNNVVDEDWSHLDRFKIRSNNDQIIFRSSKTDGMYRSKGKLDMIIEITPLVCKDYSIARFKAYVDKREGLKISHIMKKLNSNEQSRPEVIDLTKQEPIKLEVNQIVSLIGAPGTGKSTKMADIVAKLHNKRKIVYFSPTHAQVCNFAAKLKALGVKFAILSDESRVDEEFLNEHRCNIERVKEKYKNTIPVDTQVTLCTINKPIKFVYKANVEVVLIDEASKITILEAFTALYQIDSLKLLIVGGDDRQIGCEGPRFSKLENILEHADRRADVRFEVLTTYRLNSYATYVTSECFYDGKLNPSKVGSGGVYGIVIESQHVCNKTMACQREAEIAVRVATMMGRKTTLVVTPYKSQIAEIEAIDDEVRVETVDTVQGREEKNVIFSMGRPERRGFVKKNRINVATSRQTDNLVVLLHSKILQDIPELKKLFSIIEKDDRVFVV